MKVAIVILNWNGRAMMARFLPSVIKYSRGDADVIVADNASTDDSMAWLDANFPQIRQIRLDENFGFAEGYNRALRQVDAEYYVLLNSDVEVTHHWLTPLVEAMDAHPDIAACQPKLLSVADRDAFEYAGASGGYLDRYGYPFCRGRIFDTVEDDNGQYDNAQEVLWATGACLMIRSKDYWDAGGLDARFFAHNEEIDLCWRLHRMGRRIFCFPESEVYHVGGGTLPKSNPMKTFLNFRNNLTMLYKNLPDGELRHVMRVRWFLDYLAAFQTLILNGKWGDCKAIFRARRAFRKWRHEFDADRGRIALAADKNGKNASRPSSFANRNDELTVLDDASSTVLSDGRKPYSILWSYYAKGQKTFGEVEK